MTNPDELERAAGNLAGLARDLERYDPWGGTRSRSDAADLRLILAANRKMREALEPFAELSEKFGHLTVVEVSKPHPLNPSPIIAPLPVRYLTAARSALSTKETGQ